MFLFTNRAPSAVQPQAAETVPHAAPMRQASQATGVSFDYLAKTAERESRFNPAAKAPTSSATGMFQFLEQTWLGMVKQDGPRLGLANEAAAISGEGGRFNVTDTGMRQRILALREDPAVSSMMAGAFAARNGKQLEEAIGRKPSEGELYMAHFLGASGARDMINQVKSNPEAKAASSFRDAAAANKSVFFDRSGRAKTVAEVYGSLTAPFSQAPVLQAQETAATTDKAYQMFRVKEGGKPLHGLFRSNGEPVASAVSDAWGQMARRGAAVPNSETRVAFFPRETSAASPAVSDATPTPPSAEVARKAVILRLPQQGPASLQDVAQQVAVGRRKSPVNVGKPLDLMRFVKTGSGT